MKDKIKNLQRSIFAIVSFSLLLFYGCEEIPSDVIETKNSTYQITDITAPDEIVLQGIDTTFSISALVKNSQNINSISARLYNPLEKLLSEVQLNISGVDDDIQGGTRFVNVFKLDSASENGKYRIEFFISENEENNLAAVHYLNFDNGKVNQPPVLIDSTLTAPDSLKLLSSSQTVLLSIKASDENGIEDIKEVFFNSYLANGNPSSNNPFIMFDDGKIGQGESGDAIAGDGIYTLTINLPATTPTGTYRFEFFARDKKNQLSNKVVHNIVIHK